MKLKTNCQEFYNDISESIRAFLEVQSIELTENDDFDISVIEEEIDGQITAITVYNGFYGKYCVPLDAFDSITVKRVKKHVAKLSVYYCLKKATGINLPWGSLTGIRPTKLLRDVKSITLLKEKYDLPIYKGELLQRIIDNQAAFFTPQNDEVDIYIGIPFCPTRCLYCSFVSTDIRYSGRYIDDFLECLVAEIKKTGEILDNLGLNLENIYIGGGTPTALDFESLEEVLSAIKKYIIIQQLAKDH